MFRGFNRLHVVELRHRLHGGGWSPVLEREVFERGNAAAVLPYDPVEDAVVLLEQFRPGPYLAGRDPWQLEPVAGIIHEGEIPEDVARRESREEAGCDVDPLIRMCTYLVSPGYATETVHTYCGRASIASQGGRIRGNASEDEDILVHVLSFDEAMAALDAGRFEYALTLITLQWLRHHRGRLREAWSDGG